MNEADVSLRRRRQRSSLSPSWHHPNTLLDYIHYHSALSYMTWCNKPACAHPPPELPEDTLAKLRSAQRVANGEEGLVLSWDPELKELVPWRW